MSRPRLFYVLDSLEENEVGDQVATLLGRLSRARFEPRVVALDSRGPLDARLREIKVTVHRMELSGAFGAVLAVPRLRRLLAGLHADILQTFQPWSGTVAQLAAPPGAEVFRWVQGLAPESATVEGRLKAWLERRASRRRSGRFVASDEGVVDAVRHRYRVEDVSVVRQALDLGKIRSRVGALAIRSARVRLGLTESQRAVVALCDFQDRSRMYQLLEGFATARTEEPGLRLFVVGQGPEEGTARGFAEELRLEDSVIFLGSDPSRLPLLRVAEVVVDAGAWPGWARTSVEAMALPLPVLRWVDDDEDPGAQRYPTRTTGPANRFARDVLDLLEDGQPRAEAARRSAEVSSAYGVARVADRWAEIYTD
ncbi:MAG TPA: glycosyltransferase [Longimicrobiales bacterium]|nr:glycosyltransferase [Longimicrobiales bacterium]